MAIDAAGTEAGRAVVAMPPPQRRGPEVTQDPALWWTATREALGQLVTTVAAQRIRAIAVDGTSASLLLCDAAGAPLAPALMYNDQRARAEAAAIAAVAPADSGAHGAGSALAKLLWLRAHTETAPARHALHQADWLTGQLTGCFGVSDYNNALKLGYDPRAETWPDWLAALDVPSAWLPRVLAPGSDIGPLRSDLAAELGLSSAVRVVAGTTDGVAAFLASGARTPGDAVTVLGSTLVIKLLATTPVFAPAYGVYSHRLGDLWLVGGASNSGGAVLQQYFSAAEMAALTPQLQPDAPTGLDYYPLPGPGERFPISDPQLAPRMTPRPTDDRIFFQGLLEGIADIETRAYALLERLGAGRATSIRSAGAGSRNPAWGRIRARRLDAPLLAADSDESAVGAARLAAGGLSARITEAGV